MEITASAGPVGSKSVTTRELVVLVLVLGMLLVS